MAVDKRRSGVEWQIYGEAGWNGCWTLGSYAAMQLAVLMDLRDELQRLNSLLHCANFTNMPRDLRAIKRELAPMRKQRAK